MDVSIVVPLYNEEENIPALYERVTAALAGHDFTWELILVDDGSGDHSCLILRDLAERDPRVKVIRFRRNFGQTAAMAAGFDAATGEVVIPMDGDLQNDPLDIPALLARIHEGYDVSRGGARSARTPSSTANSPPSSPTGSSRR